MIRRLPRFPDLSRDASGSRAEPYKIQQLISAHRSTSDIVEALDE